MPAAQEQPTGLVTTDLQPAIEHSIAPPGSDPAITLERANVTEYEHTWRLNATEWKGFLSEPSYLDRELYLINADLTRDYGSTGWILVSSDLPPNPDGSRPILASCETTRKNAYVAQNGKVDKTISHGIGSVHCRPEYRGKGYGVRMIQELGKKLESYQQLKGNKGKFSVLYSDIGTKYYAKHGWYPFSSTHISLKPISNAGEYHQRHARITPLRKLQDLKTEDIDRLSPSFCTTLEAKLTELSNTNTSKTYVAFKPEYAQFQWHFMREEFLAEYLGREPPIVKGAMDFQTGIALIWTRTYAADSSEWHLSVLYVHIPHRNIDSDETRAALSALLLRAQWEAKQWDMADGVELWDPSEDTMKAAEAIAYGHDVSIIVRDQEHICSLKWNGLETDDVQWVANERFPWC